MSNLTLVSPKNSLSDHILLNDVKNKITFEIGKIPNFQSLKFDIELTKYILNLIENSINNNENIDKVQMANDILTSLFSFSDTEKLVIMSQIKFLLNNKHIKKVSTIKYVGVTGANWFLKKFG